LHFTAYTINPTSALFDCGRIPPKIIMDNVSAMPMKIDSLLANLSANEDFWQ